MLPFIVAGLTTGSIFALAAVGLVLTYKTSGIFNFAHGSQASAAAFLFYSLHDEHGVPWPIAAALCILVAGPIVGLLLELVARHVARAPLPMRVLATVGIMLSIQGLLQLTYPPGLDRQVQQYLPQHVVHIGSTPVYVYQFVIFAVGIVAVLSLTLFLRYAHLGLAMRAVVEDPDLLDMMGSSPVRVRRLAWILGSTTASASGVLLAPLLPLDSTTFTLLVVTAFGAAAVGAFTSLPLTYLGGLAIGVGQAILGKYFFSSTGIASGLASSLPFIILFVLLVAAPNLRRPSAQAFVQRAVRPWRAPWPVRATRAVVVAAVLLAVPEFAGTHLITWTSFLAYIMLFLSLGLLVRMSGQVSLAHISFMAIGVCAFSHLAEDHHWPWLAAFLVAGLIAAPIGALLAIPAIRFPGLYLALATLGFGITLSQMFFGQSYMFGSGSIPLTVPRPHLSWLNVDSDKGYYYFVLFIVALGATLLILISRGRLGRLLRAMSDSPTALRASGTSVNVSRVLVFCLSASLAAWAGVLDGGTIQIVGSSNYAPLQSIQLFAVVLLTAGRVPWYALLSAMSLILIPSYISSGATVTYAFTLLFGISAILMSVTPPDRVGTPEFLRNLIDRIGPKPATPVTPARPDTHATPEDLGRDHANHGNGLTITDIVVQFGGLVAVNGVSLDAPAGRITGLIGPNGAGKSTVFNSCSGLVRPRKGAIALGDRDLSRLSTPARARLGLGRSFQQMELYNSLTTRQNVMLGAEAAFANWNPLRHLIATTRQRRLATARAAEAMQVCGLDDIADEQVGILSTGQRRLVELARCLAGDYNVIMLDEPSSGLDRIETRRFGEILTTVVQSRRIAILLVEHDMSLVNDVCDHLYVIDFGKPIIHGSVESVLADPLVRSIYLGDARSVGATVGAENYVVEAGRPGTRT